MAPGEPDLDHVGRPIRVGIAFAELPLEPPLVVPAWAADARGRGPCRVGLRHVPGLGSQFRLVLGRVDVQGRLEARTALVEGQRMPEDTDRGVGLCEGKGVGDDADRADGVPVHAEMRYFQLGWSDVSGENRTTRR